MTHDEAVKLLRNLVSDGNWFSVIKPEDLGSIADMLEAWARAWDVATFRIEDVRFHADHEEGDSLYCFGRRVAGRALDTLRDLDPRTPPA